MNPYESKDLRKIIESMSSEEIQRQTQIQNEESKRAYAELTGSLKIGECSLCGGQIKSFDTQNPCFHWFICPQGIKKKHFKKYLQSPIGFFKLNTYFRWLANTEKFIGNINDLIAETSATSYLETTLKYKNIEWAFSIGHTDKEGHPNSHVGSNPHFHLQMRVDDRVFLKFNDFHIPFSDEDLFIMEVLEQCSDIVDFNYLFGYGIGILEDEKNLEVIYDNMKVTDNADQATFHTETIIQLPEGQSVSGELIIQAIEESKRTREPLGKILQRLSTDANVTVIINPGDGIPPMSKRSGKK